MMREVLTRRFSRLLKEDPDRASEAWPDLLLIDGGAGQVSAVADSGGTRGRGHPLIGVAKGERPRPRQEVFHRPGMRPKALAMNDPVLYFTQRLRDEAHRWAIGTHRARRTKQAMANPLTKSPASAPPANALLAHFGSAKAVSNAGLADLQAVEGISVALARIIHDHFHPEG